MVLSSINVSNNDKIISLMIFYEPLTVGIMMYYQQFTTIEGDRKLGRQAMFSRSVNVSSYCSNVPLLPHFTVPDKRPTWQMLPLYTFNNTNCINKLVGTHHIIYRIVCILIIVNSSIWSTLMHHTLNISSNLTDRSSCQSLMPLPLMCKVYRLSRSTNKSTALSFYSTVFGKQIE